MPARAHAATVLRVSARVLRSVLLRLRLRALASAVDEERVRVWLDAHPNTPLACAAAAAAAAAMTSWWVLRRWRSAQATAVQAHRSTSARAAMLYQKKHSKRAQRAQLRSQKHASEHASNSDSRNDDDDDGDDDHVHHARLHAPQRAARSSINSSGSGSSGAAVSLWDVFTVLPRMAWRATALLVRRALLIDQRRVLRGALAMQQRKPRRKHALVETARQPSEKRAGAAPALGGTEHGASPVARGSPGSQSSALTQTPTPERPSDGRTASPLGAEISAYAAGAASSEPSVAPTESASPAPSSSSPAGDGSLARQRHALRSMLRKSASPSSGVGSDDARSPSPVRCVSVVTGPGPVHVGALAKRTTSSENVGVVHFLSPSPPVGADVTDTGTVRVQRATAMRGAAAARRRHVADERHAEKPVRGVLVSTVATREERSGSTQPVVLGTAAAAPAALPSLQQGALGGARRETAAGGGTRSDTDPDDDDAFFDCRDAFEFVRAGAGAGHRSAPTSRSPSELIDLANGDAADTLHDTEPRHPASTREAGTPAAAGGGVSPPLADTHPGDLGSGRESPPLPVAGRAPSLSNPPSLASLHDPLVYSDLSRRASAVAAVRNAPAQCDPKRSHALVGDEAGLSAAHAPSDLPQAAAGGSSAASAARERAAASPVAASTSRFLAAALAGPPALSSVPAAQRRETMARVPSLSVLSYSLASRKFSAADQHLASYCDPFVLTWRHRARLLAQRLRQADADVVCLQDVDERAFLFVSERVLGPRGYWCTHCPHGDVSPATPAGAALCSGVAVFVRKGAWQRVRADRLDMCSVPALEGVVAAEQAHKALLVELRRADLGVRVLVAVYEVMRDVPSVAFRVAQVQALCDVLSDRATHASEPLGAVACVDMAAGPDSAELGAAREHAHLPLRSAYAAAHGVDPPCTMRSDRLSLAQDFILFGGSALGGVVHAPIVPAPAPAGVDSNEHHAPLPNAFEPSTHLPLTATLALVSRS